MRAAADGMVTSGLAAHGYAYINIDDAWEGPRTRMARSRPNEKFPDMKALADYVHGRGLKIGIYSSPGPRTCQQSYAGSYQHEEQDAKHLDASGDSTISSTTGARTATSKPRPHGCRSGLKKPYALMRDILDELDRDVVFSLCQYGMGQRVGVGRTKSAVNLWRTTGDITDTWPSMSGIGFARRAARNTPGPAAGTTPTCWWSAKSAGAASCAIRRLTPNEQLTHISLWSLQAAPLLIGADMSQIDRRSRSTCSAILKSSR